VTHWEGNLRVDFAGYKRYPLTPGPSLTSFEHGSCGEFGTRKAKQNAPPDGCLVG
jgi:hypothetical protein